ncbi:hypothetical protein D6158_27450 [Nocardia seriolae]|nr:hypothetical protein C6575_27870 [Nocardia seriolae]RLP28783.1 hypothetical protein D6158_27450 [Nocardia seriolae]
MIMVPLGGTRSIRCLISSRSAAAPFGSFTPAGVQRRACLAIPSTSRTPQAATQRLAPKEVRLGRDFDTLSLLADRL